LCAKNNIKYINLTCGRPSTQASGPKPPTTHLIRRVGSFEVCGRPGEVSLCWANAHRGLFYSVGCLPQHNYPLSHLLCRQVASNHYQSTGLSSPVTPQKKWWGVVSTCNIIKLSRKMNSNTNIPPLCCPIDQLTGARLETSSVDFCRKDMGLTNGELIIWLYVFVCKSKHTI
jgi:hypothetical protein